MNTDESKFDEFSFLLEILYDGIENKNELADKLNGMLTTIKNETGNIIDNVAGSVSDVGKFVVESAKYVNVSDAGNVVACIGNAFTLASLSGMLYNLHDKYISWKFVHYYNNLKNGEVDREKAHKHYLKLISDENLRIKEIGRIVEYVRKCNDENKLRFESKLYLHFISDNLDDESFWSMIEVTDQLLMQDFGILEYAYSKTIRVADAPFTKYNHLNSLGLLQRENSTTDNMFYLENTATGALLSGASLDAVAFSLSDFGKNYCDIIFS